MVIDSFSLLYPINAPEEDAHAVEECDESGDCEGDGGSHGDAVTEVEERCCDGPEDDGEFELKSES